MNKLFFLLLMLSFMSCKDSGKNSNFQDLDLMSYGLPIKIQSPLDPKIVSDDLGIVKEVTVEQGEDYKIQILASQAYSTNLSELIERQKTEAVKMKFFSKIIEEKDNGFIFEKIYPDLKNLTTYDFRLVRLQGDQEYIFQSGLSGKFSLEQIQNMYAAVQ